MTVPAKKILIPIVAVAVLAAAALFAIQARFDGAEIERGLAHLAKENGGRILRFEGGARLSLFPRPAVVLERGTLSGPGGAAAFAAFDEVRLNLAWSGLLGGPQRVTGVVLRGLRAEVDVAGSFAIPSESIPQLSDIREIALERADLRFGPGDDRLLRLDRALLHFDGGAVDMEGSGAGLGLRDLALRLQSAPAGDAHNLAFVINGLHGAEKFDLRVTAGALRRQPEGFAAEDINLVMQLTRGDDGFDVALRAPSLAGGLEAARAEKAVLAVNHSWKNGRLTLNYGGAASLGLAGGWLEWPEARLDVNLYEAGKGELSSGWNGATRFEAATARPAGK